MSQPIDTANGIGLRVLIEPQFYEDLKVWCTRNHIAMSDVVRACLDAMMRGDKCVLKIVDDYAKSKAKNTNPHGGQ